MNWLFLFLGVTFYTSSSIAACHTQGITYKDELVACEGLIFLSAKSKLLQKIAAVMDALIVRDEVIQQSGSEDASGYLYKLLVELEQTYNILCPQAPIHRKRVWESVQYRPYCVNDIEKPILEKMSDQCSFVIYTCHAINFLEQIDTPREKRLDEPNWLLPLAHDIEVGLKNSPNFQGLLSALKKHLSNTCGYIVEASRQLEDACSDVKSLFYNAYVWLADGRMQTGIEGDSVVFSCLKKHIPEFHLFFKNCMGSECRESATRSADVLLREKTHFPSAGIESLGETDGVELSVGFEGAGVEELYALNQLQCRVQNLLRSAREPWGFTLTLKSTDSTSDAELECTLKNSYRAYSSKSALDYLTQHMESIVGFCKVQYEIDHCLRRNFSLGVVQELKKCWVDCAEALRRIYWDSPAFVQAVCEGKAILSSSHQGFLQLEWEKCVKNPHQGGLSLEREYAPFPLGVKEGARLSSETSLAIIEGYLSKALAPLGSVFKELTPAPCSGILGHVAAQTFTNSLCPESDVICAYLVCNAAPIVQACVAAKKGQGANTLTFFLEPQIAELTLSGRCQFRLCEKQKNKINGAFLKARRGRCAPGDFWDLIQRNAPNFVQSWRKTKSLQSVLDDISDGGKTHLNIVQGYLDMLTHLASCSCNLKVMHFIDSVVQGTCSVYDTLAGETVLSPINVKPLSSAFEGPLDISCLSHFENFAYSLRLKARKLELLMLIMMTLKDAEWSKKNTPLHKKMVTYLVNDLYCKETILPTGESARDLAALSAAMSVWSDGPIAFGYEEGLVMQTSCANQKQWTLAQCVQAFFPQTYAVHCKIFEIYKKQLQCCGVEGATRTRGTVRPEDFFKIRKTTQELVLCDQFVGFTVHKGFFSNSPVFEELLSLAKSREASVPLVLSVFQDCMMKEKPFLLPQNLYLIFSRYANAREEDLLWCDAALEQIFRKVLKEESVDGTSCVNACVYALQNSERVMRVLAKLAEEEEFFLFYSQCEPCRLEPIFVPQGHV